MNLDNLTVNYARSSRVPAIKMKLEMIIPDLLIHLGYVISYITHAFKNHCWIRYRYTVKKYMCHP